MRIPPHCDTRDGPVARAVRKALESGNINHILIWISRDSEKEMKRIFRKAIRARASGGEAREVAHEWVLENAVRLHRESEGAAYTGIKPEGLDEGPVVPRAEKAIEKGDPAHLLEFISETVEKELRDRFENVKRKKEFDIEDVEGGRQYIQAFIGFVVFSHHLYRFVKAEDS